MGKSKATKESILEEFENKLWKVFDLVRGELPVYNYYLICLLLVLKKENLLGKYEDSDVDTLKERFIEQTDQKLNSNEKFSFLIDVLDVYDPVIMSLSEQTFKELLQFIDSLNNNVLSEYYALLLENLMFRIAKLEGRARGHHYQSLELSRLAYSLSGRDSNQVIYNPFGGDASIVPFLKNDSILYIGEEINERQWALGELRAVVHSKQNYCYHFQKDSVTEWNSYGYEFDLIISNPPFGIRLNQPVMGRLGLIKTIEHFIIEKGVDSIKPDGKLILVLPNGFFFRGGSDYELRQYLVQEDLIEAIISLPAGILFNTGIPINILVIQKSKTEKGLIKLINAQSFVSRSSNDYIIINEHGILDALQDTRNSDILRIVRNDEVIRNDFNLNVPRYFQKEIDGVILGAISSLVRGEKITSPIKGKYVRIKDLQDDRINYLLDSNALEKREIPRNSYKLIKSSILLATRWKSLKPTFFKYLGDPVYVSNDIAALSIDESKVDAEFLINELKSEYISEQLESLRVNAVVPSISKHDLLEVKISLPSLVEQRAKVKGIKEAYLDEKKREILYLEKITGLESGIKEQNIYLRHSLAGPASNLKGAIINVRRIIEEKIKAKIPEINQLKISPSHNLNLGDYLILLERDILKIAEIVSKTTYLQTNIENKTLRPIDIVSFLKKYLQEIREIKKNDYEIILDIDKEAFLDENKNEIMVFVQANEDLLSDVFNNLIQNSEQHAFTNKQKNRIEFFVTMNYQDPDRPGTDIVILVSNTGTVFNNNFTIQDYCRKGGKTGDNAGEGFGGYLICEIIKYFNGKLDIINEQGTEVIPETDLATSFEIILPIIQAETDENV